jgi:superfamily II DNA/RNA helicase
MKFDELGLSEALLRAVAEAGYTEPTPIQEQAIPNVLAGRDVLGTAQTGTGKTAGFTLPMIDILSRGRAKARMPRSLILEPTRELAAQVAESFEIYGKHHKLTKALLIGGESFEDQDRLLDRGVDVLIATPGRLLDHFERGRVLLRDVKIFVIDESDRMLDMGFIPDIERIAKLLPPLRQTLLFSATMPKEIRRLADAFMMNPKEVAVAPPATTAATISDFVVRTRAADKRAVLRRLLRAEDIRSALVFCNRKRDVDILQQSLKRHGFDVGALHGDMPQERRADTLEAFRNGDIAILVASDVAARGLDIPEVSHVFNFDVPHHADDYVHRIGRTGRAGRAGRAITLALPDEAKSLVAIEKLVGRKIEPLVLEGAAEEEVREAPDTRGSARRGRDKRGGERKRSGAPGDGAGKKGAQGGRRRNGDRTPPPEPEEPVVGLGDHVPAFLRRPVKRAG